MQRLLVIALACFVAAGSLFAQAAEGFQDKFDEGIAALSAGEYEAGIAAFHACLELDPKNGICAYNVACGHSKLERLDTGFEWLGKAIDWGFANNEQNIGHLESADPDLANLRADERFAAIVVRAKKSLAELTAAAEEQWRNPIILLPEGHEDAESIGALIVLHGFRETKQQIADSYWKELAHSHGLALVVPSGKVVAAESAAEGMSWFGNPADFEKRSWVAEESLVPMLAAIKKVGKLDPARTIIAGVGQGGMVAFNAAMRAPKVYSAVLTVDAPVQPHLVQSYAKNAAAAGLGVHIVLSTETIYGVPSETMPALTSNLENAMTRMKLGGTVQQYTPNAEDPTQVRYLVKKALAGLVPAATANPAEPVEAGADRQDG